MTAMNLSQARVVSPVLPGVAQGLHNAELIGDALFPFVPVEQRAGKIISFGKEDFFLYSGGRAPGSNTKRVSFGYSGSEFTLMQFALEGIVPFEILQEAAKGPGINQRKRAEAGVLRIVLLNLEKLQADLALNAGNYPTANKASLGGSSLWSDPLSSDPLADVETGKEAIRRQTGRYPNTLMLSAQTAKALRVHADIIDLIKYTGRGVAWTNLFADLFGVERVVIGGAVYADSTGALVDIWGKAAVLAFTELGAVADMGLPSYGYTYRLDGCPLVETPYEDRPKKSWVCPVTDELSPVIASAGAGYLISPAVA